MSHARAPAVEAAGSDPPSPRLQWREVLVLMLRKSAWVVQPRPLCPHLEFIVFIYFREAVHGIKRFWQEPTSERPVTTV